MWGGSDQVHLRLVAFALRVVMGRGQEHGNIVEHVVYDVRRDPPAALNSDLGQ